MKLQAMKGKMKNIQESYFEKNPKIRGIYKT